MIKYVTKFVLGTFMNYISHLSILEYYISWGITRILSLPEGYKGKYDPYFPPPGYHFDQSEPLFYFTQAITPSYIVYLCMCTVMLHTL